MSIGENLKAARKAIGLTQTDVAAQLGVANTTLSNWENGVSRPDVDNLRRLCLLYKIRPNDIYNWQQEDIPATDNLPSEIASRIARREDLMELMTAATRVSEENVRLVTALLRQLESPHR